MSELPISDNRGSLGKQTVSTDIHEIVETPPFQGMSKVVEGLASSKSKSFGGEIGATLIAGSFSHLSHELDCAKNDNQVLRMKLEENTVTLHSWKEKASVLEERVKANSLIRTLGNISITLGTALLGIAIELYRNSYSIPSIAVGVIGSGLIVLGWFTGLGAKK